MIKDVNPTNQITKKGDKNPKFSITPKISLHISK